MDRYLAEKLLRENGWSVRTREEGGFTATAGVIALIACVRLDFTLEADEAANEVRLTGVRDNDPEARVTRQSNLADLEEFVMFAMDTKFRAEHA